MTTHDHHPNHAGFTLIELLTTLMIISVLVMCSYPIYTNYILKTRRIQAEVALLDLASGLEQYHLLHQTYMNATLVDVQINQYTDTQLYRLEIGSTTETSYILKAYPMQIQQADQLCGILSLNYLGQKMISGSGKVSDCW